MIDRWSKPRSSPLFVLLYWASFRLSATSLYRGDTVGLRRGRGDWRRLSAAECDWPEDRQTNTVYGSDQRPMRRSPSQLIEVLTTEPTGRWPLRNKFNLRLLDCHSGIIGRAFKFQTMRILTIVKNKHMFIHFYENTSIVRGLTKVEFFVHFGELSVHGCALRLHAIIWKRLILSSSI